MIEFVDRPSDMSSKKSPEVFRNLAQHPPAIHSLYQPEIKTEEIQEEIGLTLNVQQQEAIHTVLNSSVCIITGGPGTGKTTVIKALMEVALIKESTGSWQHRRDAQPRE